MANNSQIIRWMLILFLLVAGFVIVWVFASEEEGLSGVITGIAIAIIAPVAGILYSMNRKKS